MTTARRTLQDTWKLIRQRQGMESLAGHLDRQYGTSGGALVPLDAGVYRVDRRDGPPWVARLFPAVRPLERAVGDAHILRFLETHAFPAERLAHADPVSTHEGQAVLVTEFVSGSPLSQADDRAFLALGEWLGRLHTLPELPAEMRRAGGAIHSFTLDEGSLRDEVSEAMSWLTHTTIPDEHRRSYDDLVQTVAGVDYGETLPSAILHPDPVPKNFVATPAGEIVAIDWTGVGGGPRVHTLAFLLLAAVSQSRWNPHSSRVDAVIAGYRRHITLDGDEYAALAAAMPLHVLVRDCGAFCMGRMTFDEVAGGYSAISRLGRTVADKTRGA